MQKNKQYLFLNTVALLISYMVIAMTLPIISVFVTKDLGFSNIIGGVAIGVTFLTTIFSRGFFGRFSDYKGGKVCMVRGLPLYALGSFVCFVAAKLIIYPTLSLYVFLLGRIVLGLGDSMVLVGMLSWNIALLGPQRSGIVFSVVGASIYGAIAIGGPLGMIVAEKFGFASLALLCTPLPLLGLLIILNVPNALPPQTIKPKVSFLKVIKSIWRQGMIVFSQGVGFAVLGAFVFLYFMSKGWANAGFAMTGFGIGFVLMRILFGHLPDKIGGIRVAVASLIVVACGQLLLWLATSAEIALVGAFFTGIGCSLVYPAMGTEVIRTTQPELRGTAISCFAVFQDIAYGATAPIVGFFADYYSYSIVFMFGFIAALFGLVIAILTSIKDRNKAIC